MKISDILWEAANSFLYYPDLPGDSFGYAEYSCDAIGDVCCELIDDDRYDDNRGSVMKFLSGLGLPISDGSEFKEFEKFYEDYGYKVTEESQGARYAWLMFAHDIALEEGL